MSEIDNNIIYLYKKYNHIVKKSSFINKDKFKFYKYELIPIFSNYLNNKSYFELYKELRKSIMINFIIKNKKEEILITQYNYLTVIKKIDNSNLRNVILEKYNNLYNKQSFILESSYKYFLENINKNDFIKKRYDNLGIKQSFIKETEQIIKLKYIKEYTDYLKGIFKSKNILESDLYSPDLLPIINKNFDINESKKIIEEVIKLFFARYLNKFSYLLENNKIIFTDNGISHFNKKLYSIEISWKNDIYSLLSLAHEVGHFIYHESNSDDNILLSEIYAKVMERKTIDYLRKNNIIDDINFNKIIQNMIYSSCIRQFILYEFEYTLLKNDSYNKDISHTYLNIKREFLEPYIKVSKTTSLQWTRSSQICLPLYSLTYPISFIISDYIVKKEGDIEGSLKTLNNFKINKILEDTAFIKC